MCAHLRAGFLQSYQHPPLREFMLCRSRQILYSHPRNIGGFTVEANMPLAIAPHFNQGTPLLHLFSVFLGLPSWLSVGLWPVILG